MTTELKRGSSFTQSIYTDEEKKHKWHQKVLYRIAKLMLLGKFGRASRLASRELGSSPKFFSVEARLKWAEDYVAVYERAHDIKEDREEINNHVEQMKQAAQVDIKIEQPAQITDDGFIKLI